LKHHEAGLRNDANRRLPYCFGRQRHLAIDFAAAFFLGGAPWPADQS
jgi:hypothetical protein